MTLPLLNGETLLACFCCTAIPLGIAFLIMRSSKSSQATPLPHAHGAYAPAGTGGNANHQVSRNGALLGTHTEAELRRLLAAGHYHPTDFYWKPGMPNWAPLSALLAQAAGMPASGAPAAHTGHRMAIPGTVLSYNFQNGTGLITGNNGMRYQFTTAHWGSPNVPPSIGLAVEFEANGANAEHIYPLQLQTGGGGSNDFYRSSDNVILSGVCAGLAHKWRTDAVLIRIAMVFIPFGWIFYIIGSMSWPARPTR
jgi:phage shock protein PspC (stress-responsive transcriptional regulator)